MAIIIIGVLGYDTLDYTVYLSMVLKNLQYDIVVADISGRESFLFNQQDSCNYSYKNILFSKDVEEGLDMASSDRGVLIIMADRPEAKELELCDSVILVSDNSYHMSSYVSKAVRANSIFGLVFRDVTDNGISADFVVKHLLKDDYLIGLLKKGDVYEIKDDILDREYKVSLEYEGITNFKNLSTDYLKCLQMVASKLTGCGMKLVEKALNKAKEGVIIEHCVLE